MSFHVAFLYCAVITTFKGALALSGETVQHISFDRQVVKLCLRLRVVCVNVPLEVTLAIQYFVAHGTRVAGL